MKTMKQALAILLLGVMLLTLVSCGSSFGTIKKNFTDAGYTYVTQTQEDDAKANMITAELEEGDISCTVHFFQTKDSITGLIPVYCMVLEFASDAELQKALKDDVSGSATLRGMIEDVQNSEYVRGNCVLVPLSLTKAESMIMIFNK